MRSDLAASTLLSVLFWSMLALSPFAAPAIMMAWDNGAAHTAELIRHHREAISPVWSMPAEAWEEIESRACYQMPGDPATSEEDTSMCHAEPDASMMRPAGMRPKRI